MTCSDGVVSVERALERIARGAAPETGGDRSPAPGSAWTTGAPAGPVALTWVASAERPGAATPVSVTWTGHARPGVPVPAPADVSGLGILPTSGALVTALEQAEVADLDDATLLDVTARWQDVLSWATALQSRAAAEIARRRSWTAEHDAAAAEVSARLRVPQTDASKLLARGIALSDHPQVMDALHRGAIDTAKADILLHSGNPLTHEQRAEAITRYLPEARDRTRRWLRDRMNAWATRVNGTSPVVEHARIRRAVYLDPAANHMGWISAHLPATDAAAVWDAVDQAAHALQRAAGSRRTLGQARADALVAIATGRLVVPPRPPCAEGGGAPATGTATETATAPAITRTTVPATGCTCGGCTCGGAAVRVIPVRPQVRVTVPATALLGLDDTPAQLDGYGPIPADTAARLAGDATWQRLVTDPVTGVLTDCSTRTYRPGIVLRRAVVARDETCTFPQCDRPARWADLDHIEPFDHDRQRERDDDREAGQTRADNLHVLCRTHHLAKTHLGWTVRRDPGTGVTTWTAPTGHTYARPPAAPGFGDPCSGDHAERVAHDVTSLAEDVRRRRGRTRRTRSGPRPGGAGGPGEARGATSRSTRDDRPGRPQDLTEPPF